MRVIIALLLCLCAAPSWSTVRYVNAGDTRARNLPAAQGYGTADSPWITPSYAAAAMSAADTMYIYGYGVPTDTTNYYQDYISFGDKYCDIVGVDGGGDSATFDGASSAWSMIWLTTTTGALSNVINIRFKNQGNIAFRVNNEAAGEGKIFIKDCIFDSATAVEFNGWSTIAVGALQASKATGYIDNCVFANLGNAIEIFRGNTANGDTTDVYVDHATMRNVKNGFIMFQQSISTGANPAINNHRFFVDNSILSADTLGVIYSVSVTPLYFNLALTNCDTFGVINGLRNTGAGATAGISITQNNIINVDPSWDTTAASSIGFWKAQYSSATVAYHSTDSTVAALGAYNRYTGWYPTPPLPSATLNYLYRGMNLMQRFEIIRRIR